MKESNMSAAETNVHFRDQEIEFLQKRTKLWLEAVLGEKFGDHTLPDLISNGNLLYRVSQLITKEMTGASPGPPEVSPRTVAQLDKKSSGKYLPYANVDTFIKTCRRVGLTDVELFSPPDAVEGKDIRQVCTSIRSLAKKARAQHIRVPDFEDVHRPLPMPKEKIEEIKGSLQHAHSNPVSPTVVAPEADIKKSERVQIISRFLSTTSPSHGPGEGKSRSEPTSPGTPDSLKASSTTNSPLSTPSATIAGIHTPTLVKSVSDIGPSPTNVKTLTDSLSPKSSGVPGSDTAPTTPPLPEDPPNDFPLFSKRALGSFKHANPHFIKCSASQSNNPALQPAAAQKPPSSPGVSAPTPPPADLKPKKTTSSPAVSTPTPPPADPKPKETPSSPAVSAPTPAPTDAEPQKTPSSPAMSAPTPAPTQPELQETPSTPAAAPPQTEKTSSAPAPGVSTPPTPADSKPSRPGAATPSTPTVSKLTTPAKYSSDHSADRGNELPTLAKLGLGSYRHAHPHFSFKKSSQGDVLDSQEEAETPRAPNGKSRAPSSNKIVENDSRSTTAQPTAFGSANKGSQGPSAPAKEPDHRPAAKGPGMQLNPRLLVGLVAGALAFVGTLLIVRPRVPNVYEVKEGDTLSKISKQVGKKSWDELVRLNPGISNPDLIYPSERLKLSSK